MFYVPFEGGASGQWHLLDAVPVLTAKGKKKMNKGVGYDNDHLSLLSRLVAPMPLHVALSGGVRLLNTVGYWADL